MQLWINVEDAAGNRYGDGPITTATGWQSTRRLDAAGTFQFSILASDPRATDLKNKRIVRCWSADENGVVERGGGIIDHIEVQPSAEGPTMLVVSGDDLLRELVYRDVGTLNLYDDSVFAPTYLANLVGPLTLPTTIAFVPNYFLHIGYSEAFTRVDFDLGTPVNWMVGTVTVQYYHSPSGSWKNVEGITNTTIDGGRPFRVDGYISFNTPAGWGQLGGYYQIRIFSPPEEGVSSTEFRSINVHVVSATADALRMVMDLAPAGWQLDGAGAFETEEAVNLSLTGGTVLATLDRLRNQVGEHFRLGVSGRRVHWLGSSLPSSGLRAIAATEITSGTMLITSLRQASDSYELYTRLYAYGGGQGDGRLTLAQTSRSAPAGYVLNKSESYIEATAAVAEYGRIDTVQSYSDITAADISTTAERNAADALFDRAYRDLVRRSQLQYAYEITVVPSRERIVPGQTVHVVYDEWVDGYHSVAIDRHLVVLEVVQQIGEDGLLTAGLTVSTIDDWPVSDARVMAMGLSSVETDRRLRLPQASHSSDAMGTPTFVAIENGMIVAVNRVTPVADGVYNFGAHPNVRFEGGVLVQVY